MSKRILHDIMKARTEPVNNTIFFPFEDNVYLSHATIIIPDGPYMNIPIHIRIELPKKYPIEAPSAYVISNLDHKYHEHVHSAGSICCDLTSNFKAFFGENMGGGWSSIFNINSLLMQFGSFFSYNIDLPKHLMPTKKDIDRLRILEENFECKECGYKFRKE